MGTLLVQDYKHYPPWGENLDDRTYGVPTWNLVVLYKILPKANIEADLNDDDDDGAVSPDRLRIENRVTENLGPVNYDRLSISCSTPCHCGEEVKYLFDENQITDTEKSLFGTSKWNAICGKGGKVTLEIDVIGEPIILSHYALKSANDQPTRDPNVWKLVAVDNNG